MCWICQSIQGAAERTPRFGRGIASGGERVQWWGARRRTAVYVPFSVYTMAWSGEHRAFIVEEFIRNGRSPVATQRAFRGDVGWPPRSPDLTPCDFFLWVYLKAKVYEQRPLTLEALKEAIRQEVAAITPEMILRVMDNYRERLHQFINIQGRHLSDILFKTRWYKTAFCILSRIKKTFALSSLVSNLLASQIGEFFLPHPGSRKKGNTCRILIEKPVRRRKTQITVKWH